MYILFVLNIVTCILLFNLPTQKAFQRLILMENVMEMMELGHRVVRYTAVQVIPTWIKTILAAINST